jgi:hypothetical protein
MATDDLDTAALAKNAYVHVQSQWGTDQADHWQSDIFMRHQLMIEARRLAGATGVSGAAAAIRELEVVRQENSLVFKMPGRLSEIFRKPDLRLCRSVPSLMMCARLKPKLRKRPPMGQNTISILALK